MYVDMHSHILPGADHGSDSLETSLKQLNMAVEAGVDTILATPHFYMNDNSVEKFLHRRQQSYTKLIDGMPADLKDKLQIFLGAEVTLQVDLDRMEGLEKLCIGDTRNILIEMPRNTWTPWVYEALKNIVFERKLNPIIAHADRYFLDNDLHRLISLEIPFQINASAFEHFTKRHKVMSFFEKGIALYLGSDIHMEGLEYTQFAKAVKRLGSMAEDVTDASRIAIGQTKFGATRFQTIKRKI